MEKIGWFFFSKQGKQAKTYHSKKNVISCRMVVSK